jgi:hypothetical protein
VRRFGGTAIGNPASCRIGLGICARWRDALSARGSAKRPWPTSLGAGVSSIGGWPGIRSLARATDADWRRGSGPEVVTSFSSSHQTGSASTSTSPSDRNRRRGPGASRIERTISRCGDLLLSTCVRSRRHPARRRRAPGRPGPGGEPDPPEVSGRLPGPRSLGAPTRPSRGDRLEPIESHPRVG